jgi:hypothetical protein
LFWLNLILNTLENLFSGQIQCGKDLENNIPTEKVLKGHGGSKGFKNSWHHKNLSGTISVGFSVGSLQKD